MSDLVPLGRWVEHGGLGWGEVAEVLLIARTALAEAAGMLDSVAARFDAGERELA